MIDDLHSDADEDADEDVWGVGGSAEESAG